MSPDFADFFIKDKHLFKTIALAQIETESPEE
jgi:hypothetical protein